MRTQTFDRSREFRAGWIAAFLGLVLILGMVFWAVFVYGK